MSEAQVAPTVDEQPTEGLPDASETYENYWGVDETFKYFLPDNKQFFEIKPMDEGGKAKFQKMTNKGVRMNQRSQEATIDVDPANERHTLIKESVVGWRLMQRGPDGSWSEFPCSADANLRRRGLDQILTSFNPKAIQDLEFFIRTKNPWMQADMDVEQIDEEIDRLVEMKKQVLEQKAGEGSSANR